MAAKASFTKFRVPLPLPRKIYHSDKAADRQQKVLAMVTAGWHRVASTAAFPIDA